VAQNGSVAAYAITPLSYQAVQLAKLTGFGGWIVGLAYVGQSNTAGNLSHLERDFGWYIDGATAPVAAGSVTTPANGAPSGTGIGSPTFLTSGTEDTFDSAWYSWALVSATGVVTAPSVPSSGTALTNNYANSVDMYVQAGGPISIVALNGTTIPMTFAPGESHKLTVGPGMSITLTYSGAVPTWSWVIPTPVGGPTQSFSKPRAMVTSNGNLYHNYYYCAFLDMLEGSGGYRFNTSLQAWLLTESRVTTSSNVSWVVLYYKDLT
jgi:hypothetical protein